MIVHKFDLIILGGGHAGVEAAYCASQFGLSIGLISMKGVGLASAPCNPSIGGIGKGQLVREIDALGGLMGILADEAGIQYRTLNESKGLAVRSTRVQIDKNLYSQIAEEKLATISNLTLLRKTVIKTSKHGEHFEITCSDKTNYLANSLIITTGTFLGGKLHCGESVKEGGRVDVGASESLSSLFPEVKLNTKRFKTGTPARILSSSIDYSVLEEQKSDSGTRNMHLWNKGQRIRQQVSCYLTRTNSRTMEIIRENKEKSPMYNGQILATGARYCPSIEDKAYRYPDKDKHHVFLEPEGLDLPTVYPSGVSTSLPPNVQLQFLKSIQGLSNIEIEKYGYAVEYDVVDTSNLKETLEHKSIPGLYFAGQVNGTSGYEEAAGQGLVAGYNAALKILGKSSLVLNRSESYIGLMIDDLVRSERDEPYRLFTARSENRLYLREDNAFIRMFSYRALLGLNLTHDQKLLELNYEYETCLSWLEKLEITKEWKEYLISIGQKDLILPKDILKDPGLDPCNALQKICDYYFIQFSPDVVAAVSINVKYEGYVKKSIQENERVNNLEKKKLNLERLLASSNISFECKQRIAQFKPETFGQLKRTSGIRPATLAVVAADHL